MSSKSRYLLLNPNWSFEGSIYFGCREPRLPLEFGYSKALLEGAGHEVLIVDGQMDRLSPEAMREQVADFRPDFTVITTAPSYLFWRCAPPELRVPLDMLRNIRDVAGKTICVGPHASPTPRAEQRKLAVDYVVRGECEELLTRLDYLPALPHQSDMAALDGLLAQGVEYVYFIDEIFLPNESLLSAFAERRFKFGIQTRIDLCSEKQLNLLGAAGCVSVEAGVESITVEGRKLLESNHDDAADDRFSDVQEQRPAPLVEIERWPLKSISQRWGAN